MGLFGTKTRRTYHRTQSKRGWSTTSKASTRLKRWTKRKVKGLWRNTKRRVRRNWKQRQRRNASHNRAIASRTVHPTGNYQANANGQVNYQPSAAQGQAGQARLPPPDGAISTCRRCSNEVQYSAGNGRWEHTARGNWECFQPHRN